MTVVNPTRQRAARLALDKVFADSSNVWVIHYSCESFYDIPDGRSPRVTSIAVRKMDSAQTVSFSIHKIAEIGGFSLPEIDMHYDELERIMLQEFFRHLMKYQQMKYLHWNMRDSNYGFQAIEHRFRVLGGTEEEIYVVDEKNKIDLARLLVDLYGLRYVGHPRLQKLLEKNGITGLDFLTGAEEAEAFGSKKFVALHQSTLRKVDVLASIAERAHDGNLKTDTNWWGMHGGRIVWVCKWLTEHPGWGFGGAVFTIIIAIITIVFFQ